MKIVNTKEITNCVIYDLCEVNGASRLSDCTLLGSVHGNVYVGTGVIIENSIIAEGSSVYQQREDTRLLRGRSLPAEQRFHSLSLRIPLPTAI